MTPIVMSVRKADQNRVLPKNVAFESYVSILFAPIPIVWYTEAHYRISTAASWSAASTPTHSTDPGWEQEWL